MKEHMTMGEYLRIKTNDANNFSGSYAEFKEDEFNLLRKMTYEALQGNSKLVITDAKYSMRQWIKIHQGNFLKDGIKVSFNTYMFSQFSNMPDTNDYIVLSWEDKE